MYQDATFEELGHSENVLLAKEICEIFLENMGTRQGRKYGGCRGCDAPQQIKLDNLQGNWILSQA